MSGVTVGTRLERLKSLLAHVKAEIEHEERALAGGYLTDVIPPLGTPGQPEVDESSQVWTATRARQAVAALGVTTAEIRAWALDAGVTESTRGPLGPEVVRSYHHAHPVRSR